jgi:HD-GYP domain-containing protein (c-di-GMP phosphodiesterase class II)
VSVADVFDALTHERPYKGAWPVRDAVAEVRRQSGRQFDPRVVGAFMKLDHSALLTSVKGWEPPPKRRLTRAPTRLAAAS